MSLNVNKQRYRDYSVGKLQAYIDVAGGCNTRKGILSMTFKEFFDQLPQNGIGIDFSFDSEFRDTMQEGDL